MNKKLKIILNILVFILIAGFGYYMIHSMNSEEKTVLLDDEIPENTIVSPYKKTISMDVASDIVCFNISNDTVYAATSEKISIFDCQGKFQREFNIEKNIRDIIIEENIIYLLYPSKIVLFSQNGEIKNEWEACSDNSDYCSFTITKDYVFVTDAENKNICQYDKQGQFIRFINSPEGFIIPSYSFGIININDTIYCSNSGKHKIESYTIEGKFISSFGENGTQAGAFAGCCNPVYLEKSSNGNILTSEKGNPRISCYSKDGKFRTILLDKNTLGNRTDAYEMHADGEKIHIADGKTISIYRFDPTISEKSCAGCEEDCPLRKGVKN